MAIRTADAEWKGNLRQGEGHMRFGRGAFDGRYNFGSRFEELPRDRPLFLFCRSGSRSAAAMVLASCSDHNRSATSPSGERQVGSLVPGSTPPGPQSLTIQP